jgi:penicillin amidase
MTQEYLEHWPRWSIFTQKLLKDQPKEWLPPEERTFDTFFITTFAQSLKNIRLPAKNEDVTKISWQWLHQIRFRPMFSVDGLASKVIGPLFNISPVGVGGDQDTVNACNVTASVDPWNYSCDSGPSMRLLIDMSDSDKLYGSLALGQSEHLFSPYRTDELKNWLRLEPHAIAFSADQLGKQQQHKVNFSN